MCRKGWLCGGGGGGCIYILSVGVGGGLCIDGMVSCIGQRIGYKKLGGWGGGDAVRLLEGFLARLGLAWLSKDACGWGWGRGYRAGCVKRGRVRLSGEGGRQTQADRSRSSPVKREKEIGALGCYTTLIAARAVVIGLVAVGRYGGGGRSGESTQGRCLRGWDPVGCARARAACTLRAREKKKTES